MSTISLYEVFQKDPRRHLRCIQCPLVQMTIPNQSVLIPGSSHAEGCVRAVPGLQGDLPRRRPPRHTHLRIRSLGGIPLRNEGRSKVITFYVQK